MKSQKWWSTADLASYMNISEATVRRRAGSGQWPSRRVGKLYRFTDEDVEAIEAQSIMEDDVQLDRGRIAEALRSIA